MLYIPSPNLYFPLNHGQRTCLTFCKEDAWCTSHPGAETNQKHMLARHSSNNQLSLNVSKGAFRIEMGLKKKKSLSIKSFTADHNGCIQTSTFFHLQCQETEFCCAFRPHVSLAHTELFIVLSTSRELTEHLTETCLRHSNVMLWWGSFYCCSSKLSLTWICLSMLVCFTATRLKSWSWCIPGSGQKVKVKSSTHVLLISHSGEFWK